MRAVFIGASHLAITTARYLLRRGHEVVVIERDKSLIDNLSADMDCGFIHGDGTRPALLQEADPGHTDALFCLTDSDQANIIASLVGRSQGFKRVVTKIEDVAFEHICLELGLEDTVIPSRTVGRLLADMCEGRNPLDLSTMIRDEARVFSFVVRSDQEGPLDSLPLQGEIRVVCLYRGDRLMFPTADSKVKADDEVVVVTRRDELDNLRSALSQSEPGQASGKGGVEPNEST